jgi:hypothetical protein
VSLLGIIGTLISIVASYFLVFYSTGIIRIAMMIAASFIFIYDSRKNKKLEQFLMGIVILIAAFGEIFPNYFNEHNIATKILAIVGVLSLIASSFIYFRRKIHTKFKLNK